MNLKTKPYNEIGDQILLTDHDFRIFNKISTLIQEQLSWSIIEDIGYNTLIINRNSGSAKEDSIPNLKKEKVHGFRGSIQVETKGGCTIDFEIALIGDLTWENDKWVITLHSYEHNIYPKGSGACNEVLFHSENEITEKEIEDENGTKHPWHIHWHTTLKDEHQTNHFIWQPHYYKKTKNGKNRNKETWYFKNKRYESIKEFNLEYLLGLCEHYMGTELSVTAEDYLVSSML